MTCHPCIRCGDLVDSRGRCPCVDRKRARQRTQRPYAWRKISQRARARQPFCTYCGATDDLTGDHVWPVSTGGPMLPPVAEVIVACRSCNAKRGNRPLTVEQLQLAGLRMDGVPPRANSAADSASQARAWSLIGAGWPLEGAS